MSALAFRDVGFTYPLASRPALDGLTLELRAGEVTWITGALGAGCSTLLLVAAGFAPRLTGGTRRGEVRALDTDPATASEALLGRIAYVSASPAAQLSGVAETVFEEVAFGPANLAWPRERIGTAVDAALARLGLTHLAARDPATLSGGELQRTVLAALLALTPGLWLLDEPASALDAPSTARVRALLREEAARGAGVVVVTEDPEFGLGVADRLVVVRDGRVALDGTPDALLRGAEFWDAGATGPALAALARDAEILAAVSALEPPYPLSEAEALDRWRR